MASNDGKIEVIIRKSQGGNIAEQETNLAGETNLNTKEQGKLDFSKQAINTALITAGKKAITLGISEFGNLTGNYRMSTNVNTAVGLGADVMTILSAGPVGAFYVTTKHLTNIAVGSLAQKNAEIEGDFLLQRAGEISKDGSR